jgi:hypothetical protein
MSRRRLMGAMPAENSVMVGEDAWAFEGVTTARTESRVDAITNPISARLPLL